MLYHIILYYTILYYTIPYHTIPYYSLVYTSHIARAVGKPGHSAATDARRDDYYKYYPAYYHKYYPVYYFKYYYHDCHYH